MEMKIIDSVDKLLFYKTEWESILKEIDNNVLFLEPDWILFWWSFFGYKYELFVILVTDCHKVLAICPLMKKKKSFYNEIGFIGGRQSGIMDIVIRDESREKALGFICNYLRKLKGNNIIKLHGMAANSKNYILLKEYLKANGAASYFSCMISYFLNMEGIDFNTHFEKKFGKETRYKMNKKEKKLSNLGYLVYKKVSAKEADEVFNIHEKRWLRKIGNSSFSKGETMDFYKALIMNNSMRFRTTVDAVALNNKIISFLFGFEYNGITLLLRVAHDDDFYLLSPGELIFKKKVEECFASHAKGLDFGPGYEPYKARWTDDSYNLLTTVLPSNNLQSHLTFYIIYRFKMEIINALKNNKIIEVLRKYYLGKAKYFISKENISYTISKIKRGIGRYGLIASVKKTLGGFKNKVYSHKQYLILEKQLESMEIFQTDMQVREASIDDLDSLSEAMNEPRSNIIRRLINNHKCYIALCNSNIIHYCWIETSIARFSISLNKQEVHIYDAFMEKKYQNGYNYTYIFSYIFNLLYKRNFRKCYIAIDISSKSFENEIYNKLFIPRYKIFEKKVLSRINHNIFDLK